MPRNYRVLSILSFFLFWPIGLFALINSFHVSSRWIEGNIEDAEKASKYAFILATIGIVISVTLTFILVFLYNFAALSTG